MGMGALLISFSSTGVCWRCAEFVLTLKRSEMKRKWVLSGFFGFFYFLINRKVRTVVKGLFGISGAEGL